MTMFNYESTCLYTKYNNLDRKVIYFMKKVEVAIIVTNEFEDIELTSPKEAIEKRQDLKLLLLVIQRIVKL